MNKTASSLIEVVVYCLLASIVIVAVMGWLTTVGQTVQWQSRQGARLITAHVVVDAISRDLQAASADPKAWDLAAGVCTKQTLDDSGKPTAVAVAWAVDGGVVRRYAGDYDFGAHGWRKRTVSIAGTGCQSLAIKPAVDTDGRRVVGAPVMSRWAPVPYVRTGGGDAALEIVVNQAVMLRHRELS